MNYGDKAAALFREHGYNCAQSVFCAFTDLTGFDEATAIRVSCSFGGGMGRLREVCSAFSGAIMVLGMLAACEDPADRERKALHYARIQKLAARFREREGTLLCRELLGPLAGQGSVPDARTDMYYAIRPCERIIRATASDLHSFLREEGLLP